ncbi:MAG: PAS domain S-box protein [Gemmataceae bacterium]|nr:PAS domain S-box protein [Gemmataceae bacterium]
MSDTYWQELAGTLFEEAGDALFLFDPDTEQLREVNPMAQRLSGFTRRELLDMKVTYLVRSEADGGLQRLRQAFRRTGLFHSQEGFWLRHKRDGVWVPVNLTVTRLHTAPHINGLITARDISERREAHALLQQAESELRRVLASVTDCLWSAEINPSGQWVYHYFSPVVERITGRPGEFYFGGLRQWMSTVHADDRPRLEEAWARVWEGADSLQQEYRIVRPDGKLCWVRDSVAVTRVLDGRTLRVDGIITDVTDRKRADEALRESESRHRLLIEQIPAIVWTTDAKLVITSSSGAGLAALNEVPNQTRGMTLMESVGSDDPEYTPLAAHWRALRGEPVTYEMVFGDRAWQSHVEPLRDADGTVVGTIGCCLDVTASQQAKEALRASEARYRNLIENLTQSIFLKDRDLRFVLANKPFCRSVGRSEAEVIGLTDFDLYPPHLAEKYRASDRLVIQEGRRLELEEQNLIHGRLRTVQKVKTPVTDEQGQVIGVLGIFWDVTDQRNLEAQLRQAHKMEAVGQLAGGIAHDFNNLLTGILGNLSLAIADLVPSHPVRELLMSAEVAGLRAAELTRQLLGFSRRTPMRSEPLNLNTSIDETVRLLRRTFDPRLHVSVEPAADVWMVQADPGQMNQVLMNLCLNARDAMPQGGKLTLETHNISLDAATAARTIDGRPGEFVRLRVRDTGCGMGPDVQERIFEPFFTTKEPGRGTGLGLAMVFGIVKQHQGWLECKSEVGHGTCFDVYLPRLVTSVATAPPPAALDGVRGGTETILLADDEVVVGRLGLTILERHGYRVLSAMDGAEALEIYKQKGSSIDLVILDLAMPRLSGPETLRELRKINPAVSVLISSGYSSDEDMRAVERAGVLGFVAKPYRPTDLARRVRAALDQARAAN